MSGADFHSDLLRRKPYLRAYLAGPGVGTPTGIPEYRLASARDGAPLIERRNPSDGSWRPLASRYDPAREAARLLPAPGSLRPGEVVLVLGLGNPLLLGELNAVLASNQICAAVDASQELGALLMQSFPGVADTDQSFLAQPGRHLFCGEAMLEALDHYIESLPAEGLAGLRILRNPVSQRLAPEFYERAEQKIRAILRSRMSDLLTRFEFETAWLANTILNSRYLAGADELESGAASEPGASGATVGPYQDALQNLPGVLISTGPSLRESLEDLRALQARAFLLACDASLKPLLRAGIQPHAVITLDAQFHTLLHFQEEPQLAESLLFADFVANPGLIRNLARRSSPRAMVWSATARVFHAADGSLVRESTPGTEHAERIHGVHPGTLQSGGSVATSGFDLLRNLGCSPILLIGQDLAYTGRKIHSSGTHHTERWLAQLSRTKTFELINEQVVRKRETFAAPDLNGRPILTDYVLNLYRQWFEESLPGVSVPVYNLTRQGARIQGAPPPPGDAPENPSSDPPIDPIQAFIQTLPELDFDPRDRFAGALPLREREHADNRMLYRMLRNALDAHRGAQSPGDDAARETREALFAEFPYLRLLARRAEVYVKRNRSKLNDERAEALYERNLTQALARLERRLRPYFGEKAK